MKLKAGDGDRTRDVQLGKMDVVCLSKTSLFNTFIKAMELRQNSRNGLFLSLNGINGVLNWLTTRSLTLILKDDRGVVRQASRFCTRAARILKVPEQFPTSLAKMPFHRSISPKRESRAGVGARERGFGFENREVKAHDCRGAL